MKTVLAQLPREKVAALIFKVAAGDIFTKLRM